MSEISKLEQGFEQGNLRSLSRLISWAENRERGVEEILAKLFPKVGGARVMGITGPPGAGKSTLVDHFVRLSRAKGEKVAVVAIDPVSPFTGGALLGDRIRLKDHFTDEGVFIRSLSTRGTLGGLSIATREVVHALDAFGFDTIFVETVGVGQSEVEVRKIADATLVVLVPEWGDGVQAIKAGILEIGDVFAVHKADREGAERVATELRSALSSEQKPAPPILLSQETQPQTIDAVLEAMRGFISKNAKLVAQRRETAKLQTLAELVEARVVLGARKWVAHNVKAQANPYEGYLKFERSQKKGGG